MSGNLSNIMTRHLSVLHRLSILQCAYRAGPSFGQGTRFRHSSLVARHSSALCVSLRPLRLIHRGPGRRLSPPPWRKSHYRGGTPGSQGLGAGGGNQEGPAAGCDDLRRFQEVFNLCY